MKFFRRFTFICLLLFFSALCAVTVPTKKQYAKWLKENYFTSSSIRKIPFITDSLSQLNLDAVTTFQTTYKDCFFFAIYTSSIQGKNIRVIGVLDHFIALDPFTFPPSSETI